MAQAEEDMEKIAAVLLNYNDGEAAMRAAERIAPFGSISRIILVDNASPDGSGKVLEAYVRERSAVDPRFQFLQNPENGGYGYGNNRGVKAAAAAGCAYTLIANPDAVFSEELVSTLSTALREETAAAAGALIRGARYTDCAWPLLPFWEELLFAGPVTKRLFRRRVSYPRDFFRMLPQKVGAVHGSLLMVKTGAFLEAGGYDENLFLFCEEKVLGQRLAAIGKETVLTGAVYAHAGSGTMKKAGLSAVRRQKERQRSERYYYRNFLGAGPLQMAAVRLQQAVVLLETRIAAALGRL